MKPEKPGWADYPLGRRDTGTWHSVKYKTGGWRSFRLFAMKRNVTNVCAVVFMSNAAVLAKRR